MTSSILLTRKALSRLTRRSKQDQLGTTRGSGSDQHRDISDFFALKSVADSVLLVTYLVALQQFGVSEEKITQAMTRNGRIAALVERSQDIATLPPNT